MVSLSSFYFADFKHKKTLPVFGTARKFFTPDAQRDDCRGNQLLSKPGGRITERRDTYGLVGKEVSLKFIRQPPDHTE